MKKAMVGPRKNYLPWDDYFMGIAVLSAQRSKDPNRQVGACIVDDNRRIMGIGYNGFPMGCSDDDLPWGGKEVLQCDTPEMVVGVNDPKHLDTKYPFVCHAEANAILNCHSRSLKGCVIYVAMFPCNECTKLIIQSGITKVVYLSDKNRGHPGWVASRKMFDLSGVEYTAFTQQGSGNITLSLCSDYQATHDASSKCGKCNEPIPIRQAPKTTLRETLAALSIGVFLGLLLSQVGRKE